MYSKIFSKTIKKDKVTNVLIILLIFLANLNSSSGQKEQIKFRLSDGINRFQPVIVPVINPNQTILFVDRQNHPENKGGLNDHDDIWVSKKINGVWSGLSNLGYANTSFSDVLFTVSPDGNQALVYHNEGDTTIAGSFYMYELENGNLINKKALQIKNFYNKSTNFYGHLSSDGKKLLLSLERDDSRGSLDLYISFYDSISDLWSEPKNLGSKINTAGIEIAPFLGYDDLTLYFSSNGHQGFGKLDLYLSRRLDDSWQNWSVPINLGEQINSNQDDNCLYLSVLADTAYIVSYDSINARQGIYYVLMPDEIKPQPYVFVEGDINKANVKNDEVIVSIYNIKHNVINSFNTKFDNYALTLSSGQIYQISFSSNNSEETIVDFDFRNIDNHTRIKKNVELNPKKSSKELHKILYFDFDVDRVNITQNFILELNEYISRSEVKEILVIGYTDKIGTTRYNEELSKRRALNTAKMLKSNLIKDIPVLIDWKGCTEPISEIDAENRRVEIYLHF